jgi:putative peptidoglycan lipid II flippase
LNLLKAASTVSAFTLLSRVTGLMRDQLIAAGFGAGAQTDAFWVAFRIPNLLRRLFGEGAFSQAFVPILAGTRERDGDDATHALVNAVATVLFWALVATCVVGVAGAPVLVWVLGAGLAEFGVLNTWRRFAVPAATPVLLNLAMIAAAWWLAPQFAARGMPAIYALAAGVMAGGVLQLAVQVPALRRIGAVPRIGLHWAAIRAAWAHPGVKRVLKQMAPALLGVSVAQLSLLINTQIASHVAVGAVSWLFYADRLMEFPTALLGVALGVVLLPQLTAAQARDDAAQYNGLLDWGLRLVLLFALPCAVALLIFPQPLVAVLFHYGAFSERDVAMTVLALRGYGAGLLGLVAVKVLAPGFYARQDIRTPVRIAIVVLVATQALNLVLVPLFGHAGLALSIGLGALVNAGWLFFGLRARGLYQPLPGWGRFAAQALAASLALGAVLWWAAQAFDWIALQARWGQRAALLAAVLGGVALLYFGVLAALGLRPRQFLRRV